MQIYFLIYVSVASDALDREALLDLLQVSRGNNLRDDITGLLLYKERKFMQLLEGPELAVRTTYDRIAADARHREITILLEGATDHRDFSDWTMGFQDLDDEVARATPGYSAFLDLKFSVFDLASDPSRAHQLLRVFRRM